MRVGTETWFVEHAQHRRAPQNGIEYSARLTGQHKRMIDYVREVLGEDHTKIDITSLAVGYAVDRPYLDWDVNAIHFEDVVHEVNRRELNGERVSWMRPADLYWEPKIEGHPVKVRLGDAQNELFEAIQGILRCDTSELIRMCLALAFAWFNSDVFYGEEIEHVRELFGRYVDVMRDELEFRTERARAQFDAF